LFARKPQADTEHYSKIAKEDAIIQNAECMCVIHSFLLLPYISL